MGTTKPIEVVLMWMSALMETSLITVDPTLSALTLWDLLLVLVNQVVTGIRYFMRDKYLFSGFTSWAAHSGCRDINECCVGSYAECTHTCARTSATSGLCFNNAGAYSCSSCSTGGTVSISDNIGKFSLQVQSLVFKTIFFKSSTY